MFDHYRGPTDVAKCPPTGHTEPWGCLSRCEPRSVTSPPTLASASTPSTLVVGMALGTSRTSVITALTTVTLPRRSYDVNCIGRRPSSGYAGITSVSVTSAATVPGSATTETGTTTATFYELLKSDPYDLNSPLGTSSMSPHASSGTVGTLSTT